MIGGGPWAPSSAAKHPTAIAQSRLIETSLSTARSRAAWPRALDEAAVSKAVRAEMYAGHRHYPFGEKTSGVYSRNRALPVATGRCYVVRRNECTRQASRWQRAPRMNGSDGRTVTANGGFDAAGDARKSRHNPRTQDAEPGGTSGSRRLAGGANCAIPSGGAGGIFCRTRGNARARGDPTC
jgi:hypothetical protein